MVDAQIKVEIVEIGESAAICLEGQIQSGRISGVTSKGYFLTLENGQVLFLTSLPGSGPMIVRVVQEDLNHAALEIDQKFLIQPGSLISENKAIAFSLSPDTLRWSAPPLSGELLPDAQRRSLTQELATRLIKEKPEQGFSPFLVFLARSDARLVHLGKDPVLDHLLRFSSSLKAHQPDQVIQNSGKILGYGRGLTPSGDDFLIGCFLSLARWVLPAGWSWDEWKSCSDQILKDAGKKTNRISITLLECAAHGQADERLIRAVDYLFSGEADFVQTLNGLLEWGNSSGIDATAGMITVSNALMNNLVPQENEEEG